MAQNLKEVIKTIRDKFDAQLENKSGWGKNELKKMHDDIIIDVLTDLE